LANLINEAALLAARANKDQVEMNDLEAAKDKVMMGAERRSLVITEKEKNVTAYHEAGHALVAFYLPDADPVHKVTIIPRGRALGVTMYLPSEEKYNESRGGLETIICTLLGGRVAEELVFNEITTGASNDIERVTGIARKMVCEWGMSDKVGPLAYGEKEGEVFLGRDLGHMKNFSEAMAEEIDGEIRRIVQEGYERTRKILSEHKDGLTRVAEALLEKETLDADEVRYLVTGEQPEGKVAVELAGSQPDAGSVPPEV